MYIFYIFFFNCLLNSKLLTPCCTYQYYYTLSSHIPPQSSVPSLLSSPSSWWKLLLLLFTVCPFITLPLLLNFVKSLISDVKVVKCKKLISSKSQILFSTSHLNIAWSRYIPSKLKLKRNVGSVEPSPPFFRQTLFWRGYWVILGVIVLPLFIIYIYM